MSHGWTRQADVVDAPRRHSAALGPAGARPAIYGRPDAVELLRGTFLKQLAMGRGVPGGGESRNRACLDWIILDDRVGDPGSPTPT
jgi:hypothetical protein